MPPRLPKDKTKLRLAKMGPKKEAYLKEWAKRHGYSQGTPCGAHINLSIDQHIIELVLNAFPERSESDEATLFPVQNNFLQQLGLHHKDT